MTDEPRPDSSAGAMKTHIDAEPDTGIHLPGQSRGGEMNPKLTVEIVSDVV